MAAFQVIAVTACIGNFPKSHTMPADGVVKCHGLFQSGWMHYSEPFAVMDTSHGSLLACCQFGCTVNVVFVMCAGTWVLAMTKRLPSQLAWRTWPTGSQANPARDQVSHQRCWVRTSVV
jgi:hypothetical protein